MKKSGLVLMTLMLVLAMPAMAVRYGVKKQIYTGGSMAYPSYLSYSSVSDRMYSGNAGLSNVLAMDCAGDSSLGPVSGTGMPAKMVYDAANNRVYYMSADMSFYAINCATDTATAPISGMQGNTSIDFNPANGKVYFDKEFNNDVLVYSAAGYTYLSLFADHYGSIHYCSANNSIYVPDYLSFDTLGVYNGSDESFITDIYIPGLSSATISAKMASNPAASRLYITLPNTDQVAIINTSSNTLVNTVAVADSPKVFALCPVNNRMFIACNGNSQYSLKYINGSDVLDSVRVGDSVSTVVYNPSDSLIYIGCRRSGYVKLVDPQQTPPIVVDSVYTTLGPQFVDMSVDKGGDVYCAITNSDDIFVIGKIPQRLWHSAGDGPWFDFPVWQYSDDGGSSWGNNFNIYPNDPNDSTITIQAGHTIQQSVGGPAVIADQLIVDGTLALMNNLLTIADGPGDDIVVNGSYQYSGGSFTLDPGATMVFAPNSNYLHYINGGDIPVATWDTLSYLNIYGVTNTMPTGMNQAFGNIEWNCPAQETDMTLPGGPSFSVRNLSVTSTSDTLGTALGLYLTSPAKPSLTVNNLMVNSSSKAILGSGGPRNLHVLGDFTIYDPAWVYLTDTLNAGIDSLFLHGNYAHLAAGIGGGGPDSTAIVFCGADTQYYNTGSEILTGYINYQVNPGSILKIPEWSTFGTGSQGDFTLMPGATLAYSDMWGIYSAGQDTGVIRNLGARNYSQGANYHIYSTGTGPYRTGPGLPDTVNQLTIESYGDQVYLSQDLTVMDSLKLLANNLRIDGKRLSLFGPIYQTSGNLMGDGFSQLVIMGGNPSPVTLPGMLRDLGLLNINRPATVSMSDTMLIYNRLELVNGILSNPIRLSLLDRASIYRSASGSLAGSGSIVFVNGVNLEYGSGTITAGKELPSSPYAIRKFRLQNATDTVIVNQDSLGISDSLFLPGAIRFSGRFFNKTGFIDSTGSVGLLQMTDSCSASFISNPGAFQLPAIVGGRLTIDNTDGGKMRGDISLSGQLRINIGSLKVGPHTLAMGDSLIGATNLSADNTSSLVFQGGAISQTFPSVVNQLSKLVWNRTGIMNITTALVLYDTLHLGQGVVNNTAILTLRPGFTIIRNSGILLNYPSREGPTDVIYGTHGGGTLNTGYELSSAVNEANNVIVGQGALPGDTVAMTGDAQVNGQLSLLEGVLKVGGNTLTLSDSIVTTLGLMLADSTSGISILNYPYPFALPNNINSLNNLTLNSSAGMTGADTIYIRNGYVQTSGHILYGQLQYGPSATLRYFSTGYDTTSNLEFPNASGPHNLMLTSGNTVFLHTSRTISGTLSLGSSINTGANTLTMDTTGIVSTGAGFVEGRLAKLVPTGIDTTITFELGTATGGHSPLDVEVFNNTVPAFVTAGISGTGHPLTADSAASLKKYWTLAGAIGADASLVTMHYLNSDFNPPNFTEVADESTMVPGRYDAGATPGWNFPAVTARSIGSNNDGGTITVSQAGNFNNSPVFTLARDSMSIFNPAADTTYPYIVSSLPGNGAAGVGLTDSVWITFSEPVRKSGVSYSFVPNPGLVDTAWSADSTTIVFNHSAFAGLTSYTVRVLGVQDTSWNPLTGIDSIRFATRAVLPDSMSFNLAGGAYRMFSVPLSPVDSTPAQILGDELGAYSDSTWRIFGYKPSSGYVERPNISSGYGYWLATASNALVEVKGTRLMNFFNQPLDSGWNLIGDPFDTTVTLANVTVLWSDTASFTDSIVNSVVRQRMYNWQDASQDFVNNGVWDSLTPYTAGDQMYPWTGYALYAVRPCTLRMERSMGKQQDVQPKAPQYDIDWQLNMDVASGNAVDRGVKLGVSTQAREDYDRLDAEKPPLISTTLKAFIPHRDWNQGPCHDYQYDFRPAADYIEWPVMIETARADQPVVLSSQITGELGNGGSLYLLNRRTGKAFDLKTQKIIGFSGAQELVVVYSSKPFDGRTLTPLTFGLGRIGPNPFIQRTTINYQLTQAGLVSISVFNIAGQRVRSLVSQNLPPGYYSQVWDGRNDGGRALSAGVYIIRLSASGQSAAQKIVKLQ